MEKIKSFGSRGIVLVSDKMDNKMNNKIEDKNIIASKIEDTDTSAAADTFKDNEREKGFNKTSNGYNSYSKSNLREETNLNNPLSNCVGCGGVGCYRCSSEIKNKVDNDDSTIKEDTYKEKMKELKQELRLLKERRTEKNRPTLWINKDKTRVEIHYNNKTILCNVDCIDTETTRDDSDNMAEGSNYKQIIYKTDEGLK